MVPINLLPNQVLLRKDIAYLYEHNYLTILPNIFEKQSEPVMALHALDLSKDMVETYHNVKLRGIDGVLPEYMFAGFARAVFRQLQPWLLSYYPPRRLLIVQDDGEWKTEELAYEALQSKYGKLREMERSERLSKKRKAPDSIIQAPESSGTPESDNDTEIEEESEHNYATVLEWIEQTE